MELTKRQALEITQELWEWLAETGGADKYPWPGWEKKGEMSFDCPLCEFAAQKHSYIRSRYILCAQCPLYLKWGDEEVCDGKGGSSPYKKWCAAGTVTARKRFASQIVKLCRAELEIMDSEKNKANKGGGS